MKAAFRPGAGFAVSLLLLGGQAPDAGQERVEPNRLVREGLAVEFSVAPSAEPNRKELKQGDSVEIKFRITDQNTGAPVTSLYPGGWLDVGRTLETRGARDTEAPSCQEKIGLYLRNIVGIRPIVDLNSYFLLVLNKAPSISVIDPRVGITGRTNLFAQIQLKQAGADWTKNRDHTRLYVSMPQAGQVAVIATENFKVIGNVDAGANPQRLVLQRDEEYLWVGNDSQDASQSGVTVIDAAASTVTARIPTGRGHHEIVFSADDRYAFVSNRDERTVSVIDIAALKKVKDLHTGPMPISLAYSPLSRAVYVADGQEGVISVVDSQRLEILARIQAKPGLGPLRFTADGRWGMVVNTVENAVHVVDSATNRLAYTIPVGAEPYHITMTQAFAYVRSLGTERVSLIQLALLGGETMPAPNTFPAGASPPNKGPELGMAAGVTPAAKEAAAYVLSPADNAIYHYMEGMNAPSGSFRTYGESARGIEIIDRSLREREPGVYSTQVRLPVEGAYDVAFLLDSPRMLHCFSFAAKPDSTLKRRGPELSVDYLLEERKVAAGHEIRFSFRLTDTGSGLPGTGLVDARVLFYAVPGLFRREAPAREISEGLYEARLTFPKPGSYYVYVSCPSKKVRYGDLPYRTLLATSDEKRNE